MFTTNDRRRATRRGVVLILVLGMLGLMALIGVMFATYSGQAEINARNYALAQNAPDPANLLDFALAQLINDTDHPLSALRGHSLKRDMYGNDASNNGYLVGLPELTLQSATPVTTGIYTGLVRCVTNILSADSNFNNYDFTRWILRFPPDMTTSPTRVAETFEVIADDRSGTNRAFYLSPPEPVLPSPLAPTISGYRSPVTSATQSRLIGLPTTGEAFELDGRYLRAFNGPGMGAFARLGNFRINGGPLIGNNSLLTTGNPNLVAGMDEDYDACDLENWFMAIQSADGQVIIPSFHRPGILVGNPSNLTDPATNDWRNIDDPRRMAKILRPRAADGHNVISFPDLVPDPATGKITYDVDNDGDGVTDAVWLDLGYPATRNAAGQLQKPLFAFTVIGLNGRMPLNTAGNLQLRAVDGTPLFRHAAHLGNSPSEIDPTFALQNAFDSLLPSSYSQFDNAGVDVRFTQSRNLLTGTRPQDSLFAANTNNSDANSVLVGGVSYFLPNNMFDSGEVNNTRSTASVAGRWGEEEAVPRAVAPAPAFNSLVRAGLSQGYGDARDDNLNSFDPWPSPNAGERPSGATIRADYFDAAGGLSLPSERIRRFLTPIDAAGDGRVTTWDTVRDTGADAWGRVSFLNYFRPPGVPVATFAYPTGTIVNDFKVPNLTNNPYHGYEAFRRPNVTALTPERVAGMPFNVGTGASAPTYNQNINSNLPSAYLNEADEMRLYSANGHDAPFGPSDLEWLYRLQDVDGASLNSRLSKLAPVSFLNPYDGIRRRRMLSTDTWETTNFVWANDNPQGVFATNSRFVPLANASFANLKVPAGLPAASPFNNALFNNLAPGSPANGTLASDPVAGPPARTPALAHRDRKINLNYPLPVSNDPNEPIRQKWIRDTYRMMKAVLPPLAVDTPQELAQLSQFVVNIIDFRDPDSTMTRFVNPDLKLLPVTEESPATGTTPATYDPPSLEFVPDSTGDLVQFGMEYSPIAINEVLAYSFTYRESASTPVTPTQTSRMYVELVNTLTDATGTPSSLDLTGWQMVILPDDPRGRPDPVTGQIPTLGAGVTLESWAKPGDPVPNPPTTPVLVPVSGTANTPLGVPIPALRGPTATAAGDPLYHYVLGGNTAPDLDQITDYTPLIPPGLPRIDSPIPPSLVGQLPVYEANSASIVPPPIPTPPVYLWLYLLRPANPFDATSSPMVVADCMRFPFSEGGGIGMTDPSTGTDTVTLGAMPLYSVQRLQPYRGGHSVPPVAPGGTAFSPRDAYGYSEQTSPPTVGGAGVRETLGMYRNTSTPPAGEERKGQITQPIHDTIGNPNVPSEPWDYLPFHDRDFTSVAELLLVPGCPPGLFTKKFAELAPPQPTPPAAPVPPNVTPPTTRPGEPKQFNPAVPHPFPYLVDNFFYTGASAEYSPPLTTLTPPYIGGLTGSGWFKMFEFMEVPSPAFGSIGTVSQGNNYDWYRQDLKPGLLNLNLIIDEEVFLGLMADPRLNMAQMPFVNAPLETGQAGADQVPKVVTMIDPTGSPVLLRPNRLSTYPITNQGFLANVPYNANNPYVGTVGSRLKVAFSDFLKLRHGGSGYLFAFGEGAVGQSPIAVGAGPIARERPFHALSYPDINFTVMRPAALPPSNFSSPTATTTPLPATQPASFVWDPGVKNPYLFANPAVQPPPIPPRRLIQIPDHFGGTTGPVVPASNASVTGDPGVNRQITHTRLRNTNANLTALPPATPPPNSFYLGGSSVTGATPVNDMRQHPYFRTEWLQKVMNLTTVRTHQYAVWITVGFFEVTTQGNPQLAASDPSKAYDRLGLEIGAMAGRNVRYRSFFILDRTRAHGFNPSDPSDFHEVVVYRKRIQ